jgi:hypothetical protein
MNTQTTQESIKVFASNSEQVTATGALITLLIEAAGGVEPEVIASSRRFVQVLLDACGLPNESLQPRSGGPETTGEGRFRVRTEDLEKTKQLLEMIESSEQFSLEGIEWSYPDYPAKENLLRLALAEAQVNAQKVADAMVVRLLEQLRVSESITEEAGSSPGCRLVVARVELEYRTSKFSQARVDLKMLSRPANLPALFTKAVALKKFMLQYRANVSRTSQPAGLTLPRRALVAGHFSIPGGGGTFGDIEAKDKVCEWLSQAGIEYDVAANPEDGVTGLALTGLDERAYGIFIFVCGPWYPHRKIFATLLNRFGHCLKIGINLTTFEPGSNGFDYLLARDQGQEQHTDLAFGRKVDYLPVVGVLLVGRQSVYGARQRHDYVGRIIDEFLTTREVAPVFLDTNAAYNKAGIRNNYQFESIVRKLDAVLTNRLHGLVLGLKNAVPVIAIDAVAGGGKVSAQASALGWPLLIPAEGLSVAQIRRGLRQCLDGTFGQELQGVQERASASLEHRRDQFMEILGKF